MSLRPLQICLTRVPGTRMVMLALLLFGAGLWAVAQEATPPEQVPIPGTGPEAGPAPVPDELPPPPANELPSAAPTPVPTATPAPTPVQVIAEPEPAPAPEILSEEPAERERAGLPIYMRELNLRIFDPGRGEELTALQEAAQLMSQREKTSEQRSLAHIQNLLTYEYTLEGTSQTQIIVDAQTRALKSASARVYFADYLLLGRDLLEPYLRQYGAPSVARTTVLDQRLLAEGRQSMTVRVSVNLDQLYRDLNEKHFIAKPNLRPTVAVLLQELVNGEPDAASGGRQRIEQTMDRNLFRVFSRRMAKPPLNSNLNSDPELLRAARFEAQRNDVDIVVTGVLTIRSADRGPILYDEYAFQEADLVLRMYRVDTGELLKEVVDRYSASGPTPAQATSNVLDAMMARATQKLADYLRVNWGRQMLEEDYTRVMISGVADDEIPAALNALRSFAPGVEIYQKAYYGDVLVVNVVLPKKHAAEDFASFLRASREPQFDVDQVAKRRFILEVI